MKNRSNARNSRFVGLAVTTALATTVLAGCAGQSAPSANYSAAQAEAALVKGKSGQAVTHAEAAVLAAPRDAYARTLLANAYLEAGRFASAVTTFADAVQLGDTAPRTIISYALAQVGTGDQLGAARTLTAYQHAIDPADFGLAIALAGNPQYGAQVLTDALRQGNNTPKVRQNLAYALALAGDWRSARLMAAEDVPADQVGDRIAQWAEQVGPDHVQTRVAALLGVRMVSDSGQPVALALANHPANEQLAAEAVAATVAEAETAPASSFAMARELPAAGEADTYDAGEARLADASFAAPAGNGIRFVSNPVVQDVPARAANFQQAFSPAAAKPAAAVPTRAEKVAAAPSLARLDLARGDYAVQLGSFSSVSAAHDAWKEFQRRYPALKDAEKVVTKARVGGKVYYRVAAAGFARASAQQMCSVVKGHGGGCLAYASARPLPGAVSGDIRVAAR